KVNKLIEQNLFGELGVIVCTDDTLGDLVIRNAQHIIHFSLPKIWTTFTQRFAASFDYYKDFVCNKSNLGRPKSLIFVDAGNKETMPRIIDFMRFRCSANIPEHILKIAEKNRILREENRETQTVKFCENLLLFGKCYSQYTCKYRHTFTKFDRSHENVPTAGEIKFLILSTHTPTHYTVRLLEHRPHKGMPWHKIPRANEYFYLQRRLEQHFENVKDHSIVHAPKFGDLCVVDDRDDGDDESVFKRCEIVAINKNKSVELLLIDTNKRLHGISCMDLLQMPQYLKLFPRQAFELRIAGVAPQDFDVNWSSSSKKTVAQWVASAGCVQGEIELTVMNCIWVRSMKIIEKLQSISYEISPVDIKDKIIKYEFGVVEENAIKMLRKMAQRTGILNNNPNLLKPEILTTLRQSQERGRGRGKVFSQSSTDSINSSKHSVPVNQSYEAKLTVEEFSNSSGGTSTVEECWETLYRDTFYEVEIGEFYSPTNFYVVLANKLKGFRSLRRLIEKFTNKSTNLIPLSEVAVGRVCLAKVECSTEEETPRYERAKIMNIDETTVTIFLADYGSKMKVSVSDLMEIPEKFKKRFPFQAIFCKMVGVRPTNESGQWTDIENEAVYDILCEVGHDLFLHIAGSPNISEDVLKCNSYDVVLFDKSMMRNLNAFIVEENHAKFHPDTVNLIDVNVDYNRLGSEEENWDNYEFDDDDEYDDNEVKSSTQPNNLQAICSDESDTEWDVQISEEEARELLNLPKQPISRPENSQSTPPLPVPKEVETATTQSSVQIQKPFQLAQKAKVPYVIWSQTLQMVTMYISAADVSDYSLKVASRFVHLSFIKNNVRFEAVWNLNACVEPQFTRHEIRGLNIVVRLKKSLSAILWPRLVQSREKNQFITKKVDSNDDSDDVDENIRRGYNSNNNFVPSSSLSDNEEEFDDIDTSDVDLA
ncbi:putative ATP-dependent RNA helicase TDRD12, partial [Pseudolycoriella hygida]